MRQSAKLLLFSGSPVLPANNRIGWIGDSRLSLGLSAGPPVTWETVGLQFWGPSMAEGRARSIASQCLATSGDTSDDIIPDATTLAALSPDIRPGIVVILVSQNDRGTSQLASWSLGKIDTAISILRAAGIVVLLCNEMPVDFLTTEAPVHIAVHLGLNARHNPSRGIYVVDTWGALESSVGSNAPAAGVYIDQAQDKHPSVMGAYLAGRAVATVLRNVLPLDNTVLPSSGSDTRLLSVNPFMTGTGGTITTGGTGGGTGGTFATSFTFLRASAAAGIVCTLTKEADPLLGQADCQKYVFSGTPAATGAVDIGRQNGLQAGLGASQYAEHVLDVVYGTDFSNMRSFKSGVRIIGGSDNWHTNGDEVADVTATGLLPTFASPVRLVIRSPRIQNPGSLTDLVCRPGSYQVGAVVAAGTMWVRCNALLKYDAA